MGKEKSAIWITSIREQPSSPPTVRGRSRQTQEALSEACLNQNALQLSPMVWTLASDLVHFRYPIASGFIMEEWILRDSSKAEKKISGLSGTLIYMCPSMLFIISRTGKLIKRKIMIKA